MKLGLYPGSFNPWHSGHKDILLKSLQVFDLVVVCIMVNPDKKSLDINYDDVIEDMKNSLPEEVRKKVSFSQSADTLLSLTEGSFYINGNKVVASGVIRGLRNGNDLQYEMNQQYWNEDVGVKVPFVYFITDRSLAHISSSAIRTIKKLGLDSKCKEIESNKSLQGKIDNLTNILVSVTHHEGALYEHREQWLPIVQSALKSKKLE